MGWLRPRITGSAERGKVSARKDRVSFGRDGAPHSLLRFAAVRRWPLKSLSWRLNDRASGVCSGIWWRKASAGFRIVLPNRCPRSGCW